MLPYLLVAMFLAAATLTTAHKASRWARFGCLGVMVVFIGLRYQLGYDWVAYERLFDFVPNNFDFSQYELVRGAALRTEPIFYAFIVTTKSLGGSFEVALFILATFNIFVIDRACQKIMPGSQPFVWLVYFCAALLAVQFNVIRQAAASSFVILSLLMLIERRYLLSALAFALAFLVHVSVLMILPVYGLFFLRPRWAYFFSAMGIGIILLGSGIFIGGTVIGKVGSYLPEFIGSKTDNYIDELATGGALSTVSPLAIVLATIYCAMLFEFMRFRDDPAIRIAIYLTLLVLFAHTGLAAFPSIWNRLMCVSLPWQLACLWRTGFFHVMPPGRRSAALVSIALFGSGVLSYELTRPESVPFMPYHSLIQVWAFGDEGDGRVKAEATIRDAELRR